MNSMFEMCERVCPTTALLNVMVIGVSLSDIEVYFKLGSYGVAIVWTSIKVIQEIRHWNANKRK